LGAGTSEGQRGPPLGGLLNSPTIDQGSVAVQLISDLGVAVVVLGAAGALIGLLVRR